MALVKSLGCDGFEITHTRTENPKASDFYMHVHDMYEILCFVSGNAEFIVEGNIYRLSPGCIMLARCAEGHKLSLKGDEPYERYVINFSAEFLTDFGFSPMILKAFEERKLGEKNIYYPEEISDVFTLDFFEKMFTDAEFNEKRDVCSANLAALLCTLNTAFLKKTKDSLVQISDRTLLEYVNKNLFEDISLEAISKNVHLSVSQVNRTFKELTGSSVYHYIISKRLVAAQRLIISGKSAAEACGQCGFKDYSSFFRLYKKRFGVPPSAAKSKH